MCDLVLTVAAVSQTSLIPNQRPESLSIKALSGNYWTALTLCWSLQSELVMNDVVRLTPDLQLWPTSFPFPSFLKQKHSQPTEDEAQRSCFYCYPFNRHWYLCYSLFPRSNKLDCFGKILRIYLQQLVFTYTRWTEETNMSVYFFLFRTSHLCYSFTPENLRWASVVSCVIFIHCWHKSSYIVSPKRWLFSPLSPGSLSTHMWAYLLAVGASVGM